jgi:hypothetical protein
MTEREQSEEGVHIFVAFLDGVEQLLIVPFEVIIFLFEFERFQFLVEENRLFVHRVSVGYTYLMICHFISSFIYHIAKQVAAYRTFVKRHNILKECISVKVFPRV